MNSNTPTLCRYKISNIEISMPSQTKFRFSKNFKNAIFKNWNFFVHEQFSFVICRGSKCSESAKMISISKIEVLIGFICWNHCKKVNYWIFGRFCRRHHKISTVEEKSSLSTLKLSWVFFGFFAVLAKIIKSLEGFCVFTTRFQTPRVYEALKIQILKFSCRLRKNLIFRKF